MSRVLWIDASVGVAGDMLLGALLDAGAPLDRVAEGLATLGFDGWTLRVDEVRRGAFRAAHAVVEVAGHEEEGGPEDGQDHGHDHAHGHDHGHDHGHGHGHGAWRDIRARIAAAPLPERVRRRALAAYGRLAEAEAKLHGMAVDDVVLHEVGAVDAVVDVVGTCLALEALDIDAIVATPLPMGTGRVRAAHGALPLPAPATLEVLRGWPVVPSAWPGEWVTPTGAALIAALATPGPMPAMVVRAVGYGAGRRDPPQVANLVRVVVGDAAEGVAGDTVVELACNLDDVTGQIAAPLIDTLLADGALDAWIVPAHMKKGRPGLILHALARPADADRLAERILRDSPTLGVRRDLRTRAILDRWWVDVATPYGAVRVKVGGRDGVAWHAAPEYDDVAARAVAAGVPIREVWEAAIAAWREVR